MALPPSRLACSTFFPPSFLLSVFFGRAIGFVIEQMHYVRSYINKEPLSAFTIRDAA